MPKKYLVEYWDNGWHLYDRFETKKQAVAQIKDLLKCWDGMHIGNIRIIVSITFKIKDN